MPAYSFKKQFILPIQAGLGIPPKLPTVEDYPGEGPRTITPKRQTIRAIGKRRHARPGEVVQLYHAMRTKQCFQIGVGRCTDARDIVLTFGKLSAVSIGGTHMPDGTQQRQECYLGTGLDEFARKDGFRHWREMVEFWRVEHGDLQEFIGVLIEWEPIR